MDVIDKPTCQKCRGLGFVCEIHPDRPMDHKLRNGRECPGAGMPCEEPGCPHRWKDEPTPPH